MSASPEKHETMSPKDLTSIQAADVVDAPPKDGNEDDIVGSFAEIESVSAPDHFDPNYETSKWEIWSYYSYYIGNNGLSLFNFAPTAAQNLLYQQAEVVGGKGNQYLHFAGQNKSINSIILLCNGISFAIQIILFLILGSFADFGTFRPIILIALSIVAYAVGFGWLGVHTPDKWHAAVAFYIIGLILYQLCLTY
jgi:MFS-type transporter involved in bile tolerance (Atg22 family)